jgi:hypothetical protein
MQIQKVIRMHLRMQSQAKEPFQLLTKKMARSMLNKKVLGKKVSQIWEIFLD